MKTLNIVLTIVLFMGTANAVDVNPRKWVLVDRYIQIQPEIDCPSQKQSTGLFSDPEHLRICVIKIVDKAKFETIYKNDDEIQRLDLDGTGNVDLNPFVQITDDSMKFQMYSQDKIAFRAAFKKAQEIVKKIPFHVQKLCPWVNRKPEDKDIAPGKDKDPCPELVNAEQNSDDDQ